MIASSAAFPPVPRDTLARCNLRDLALRPFGLFEEDLDVDFERTPRPYLETRILRCCTRTSGGARVGPEFFWGLELGKRTECLLTIAALGDGSDFAVNLRCGNPACRRQMEIELTVDEIASLQRSAEDSAVARVQAGSQALSVRRPTGEDQLAALKQTHRSEASAREYMAVALIADGSRNGGGALPESWVEAVGEALDDLDPLVNFSVRVNCPFCERSEKHYIDLGDLALRRLQAAQQRLVHLVHRLGSYYHWSEREIFAVPHWRRLRYLRLIERDDKR